MSSNKVRSLCLLFSHLSSFQHMDNFKDSFSQTMQRQQACRQSISSLNSSFVSSNHLSFLLFFVSSSPIYQIVQLFSGESTTGNGDTLASLRELGDEDLESRHDYIQYMFPSEEASQFNSVAPTITPDVIEEFKRREELRNELVLNFQRILAFLDFGLTGE